MKKILPVGIALSLASHLPLLAQQQEQKLLDRIQRPDMQLGSPLQSKSFSGTAGPALKGAALANKAHHTAASGTLPEFSGARSFLGIKNPWFGQRAYTAKQASLATRAGLDVSQIHPLKATSAQPVFDAAKKADAPGEQFASKPFSVRGAASGAMQQISDKVKKEMTIDDVRELLNKPR